MSLYQCQMVKRVFFCFFLAQKPKILVTKQSRFGYWDLYYGYVVLCFQGMELYEDCRCVHFPLIDLLRPGCSWLISHHSLLHLPPSASIPTCKHNTKHLTMTSFERVIINCTFYSIGVLPLSFCVSLHVSWAASSSDIAIILMDVRVKRGGRRWDGRLVLKQKDHKALIGGLWAMVAFYNGSCCLKGLKRYHTRRAMGWKKRSKTTEHQHAPTLRL